VNDQPKRAIAQGDFWGTTDAENGQYAKRPPRESDAGRKKWHHQAVSADDLTYSTTLTEYILPLLPIFEVP
jgi:hypothetical protein